MDARLVEFAEVLRQNGLKVSLTETSDAARAVSVIGLEDPNLFRATLKTCLCKRAGDVPTFDRAFEYYFTGAAQTLEAIEKSLLDRIREQGLLEGDELTMLLQQMAQTYVVPFYPG